jgi:hypothetical protein
MNNNSVAAGVAGCSATYLVMKSMKIRMVRGDAEHHPESRVAGVRLDVRL